MPRPAIDPSFWPPITRRESTSTSGNQPARGECASCGNRPGSTTGRMRPLRRPRLVGRHPCRTARARRDRRRARRARRGASGGAGDRRRAGDRQDTAARGAQRTSATDAGTSSSPARASRARARPAVLGLRRRARRVRARPRPAAASTPRRRRARRARARSSRPAGARARAPAGIQHERYRSHRAVRELLERLAPTSPLVLVLDDLHWADSGVGRAARGAAAPPALGAGTPRRGDASAPGAGAVATALERADRAGALDPHRARRAHARRRRELLGGERPRRRGAVRRERRQPLLPRAARALVRARGRAYGAAASRRWPGSRCPPPWPRRSGRSSRCSPRAGSCWRARPLRATSSSRSWPPRPPARRGGGARGAGRAARVRSRAADRRAAPLPLPAPARAPRRLRVHAGRLAPAAHERCAKDSPRAARPLRRGRITWSCRRAGATRSGVRIRAIRPTRVNPPLARRSLDDARCETRTGGRRRRLPRVRGVHERHPAGLLHAACSPTSRATSASTTPT